MNNSNIKFLESPYNLKAVLKESVGKTLSTTIATEISTCLQQGRFFFEAADNSPLEIRPLQVFYGILSFSKAITASRNVKSTSSLVQRHGLKDISSTNSILENLEVKIQNKGTFQEFNDTVCCLESINYFGKENEHLKIFKPTSESTVIADNNLKLKEILSRIPHLSKVYQKTFNEEANCLSFSLFNRESGLVDLRIDIPQYFHDRSSLISLVSDLREKYPFLKDWLLSEAQRCWGNSVLIFSNVDFNNVKEFDVGVLPEIDGRFDSNIKNLNIISFESVLPPLAGGVTNNNHCYIKPIYNSDISEYSLVYMAAFLLSSLVRYRPELWVHSINGRNTQNRNSDDRCMAMIEDFLEYTLSSFPQFVQNSLEIKLED